MSKFAIIYSDDLKEYDLGHVLTLPSSTGEGQWEIKAQVLWYNKVEGERRYQFDVGLSFVDVSPSERENLTALLKSHSSS